MPSYPLLHKLNLTIFVAFVCSRSWHWGGNVLSFCFYFIELRVISPPGYAWCLRVFVEWSRCMHRFLWSYPVLPFAEPLPQRPARCVLSLFPWQYVISSLMSHLQDPWDWSPVSGNSTSLSTLVSFRSMSAPSLSELLMSKFKSALLEDKPSSHAITST